MQPARFSFCRNRSQTLGSESSLDEGGVFDCLKPDSPTSPQQLFSGLVGVSAGNVSSAPFQAAGLVLGSPPDVFIQMASSSRDEGSHRTENPPYLPRPPQHHHHHHHHHHSGQHRSSLLHAATSAERHGSREDGGKSFCVYKTSDHMIKYSVMMHSHHYRPNVCAWTDFLMFLKEVS